MLGDAEPFLVSEFLSSAEIPTILIFTKCDSPRSTWQVNDDDLERYHNIDNVECLFGFSPDITLRYKNIVATIVRKITVMKAGKPNFS